MNNLEKSSKISTSNLLSLNYIDDTSRINSLPKDDNNFINLNAYIYKTQNVNYTKL